MRGITLALVLGGLLAIGFANTAYSAPRSKLIEFWDDREESSSLKMDYSVWNELLANHVVLAESPDINRFDYGAITDVDRARLASFISYMESMEPRQMNSLEQKAYWLNLFNACLIKYLIEAEPKRSVRELGGRLWRRDMAYISMQDVSLDNIEHGILRPIFNDPRVHFSLVAGTIGSGELSPIAFTADNVEQLLEENTHKFINHPRGVKIEGNKIIVSQIFRWYRADFGGNTQGVREFILRYLDEEKKAAFENIKSLDYEYSWRLNKVLEKTTSEQDASSTEDSEPSSNTSQPRGPRRNR